MIKVRRFSHATFETPDIEQQIDYYTQVLGLALAAREGGRAHLVNKFGDLTIQLEQGAAAQCARLSFQVDPQTDIDEIRRGIAAEGVQCEVRSDTAPGVPQVVTFEDPRGAHIDIFASQSPIAESQPVSGIGPMKLGHMAFCVDDPQKYVDFYSKVMGFRLSDFAQDWMAFLRCGPDHHCMNFVRATSRRMHHMAFEVKDWAQIQGACDFLGSKNINIINGPGRHGPGHNIYVYHRNPDDHVIEVFTELDVMLDEELGYFDPRPWHSDKPQRPKVWDNPRDVWGTPPTPDYLRQRV